VTHPHGNRFALIHTSGGPAVLAVDDISHALPIPAQDMHPAFGEQKQEPGTRVHFKAKGSTHLDLPGITPIGLASALNGEPF
jgi:hypothetical protein